MKSRSDKTLADPPTESISSVKFLPSSDGVENLLVAASWDGSLTLYDYQRNVNMKYKTDDIPVLSISPVSSSSVCYGGLAQTVFIQDVDISQKAARAVTIGHHNDTICSVSHNKLHNIIVSGGYDSTIRLWSTQQNKEDASVGTITTEKEVLCMDVRDNIVAAGIAGGFVKVWDLRNLSTPLKVSEKNSLNLQCIAIFPDQKKFVYGTAEGRASIESIDSSKDSKGDFTFKPHVDKVKGIDHPVNAVSFVEGTSKFLMGGSDGKLRMWEPNIKKLIADFPGYPNEIAAVDTSETGSFAVVACSYLDDRDIPETSSPPPPAIFVRSISEYVKKSLPLTGGNSRIR